MIPLKSIHGNDTLWSDKEETEGFMDMEQSVLLNSHDVSNDAPLPLRVIRLRIALVVAFYFTVSISLVFLNKFVMNYNEEYAFPYPLCIVLFQLLGALVLISFCSFARVIGLAFMPPLEFKLDIARKIMPLPVIFAGMLVANQICLSHVVVSMYFVARSLSLVFNVFFTHLILGSKTSTPALSAVALVLAGYIVARSGKIHMPFRGALFGFFASVFIALNSVFVKQKLAVVGNDQWRLLMYNTIISIVILTPFVLFSGELTAIFDEVEFLHHYRFWLPLCLTALLGFLINIASFLQIKFTSPITHNISGTVKACVQTVLGVFAFGQKLSLLNGIGILLCIFGSFFYSTVRYKEMSARRSLRYKLDTYGSMKGDDGL